MILIRLQFFILLYLIAWPTAANDMVSEEVSQKYYFGLMQKAASFRVHPGAAPNYLRGVWRLDRRAHIGGGHYVRADQGDDVTLICNDERLIQIDFNRNDNRIVEFTGQLSNLKGSADGSMHFGEKKRRLIPLDYNHLAIARYDYIAILERVSGGPDRSKSATRPAD